MLGVCQYLKNFKRLHLGLYCQRWRVWSEGMSESSCVQVPGLSGGSVRTPTRPPAACLSVPHGAPPVTNTCHHLAAKKLIRNFLITKNSANLAPGSHSLMLV